MAWPAALHIYRYIIVVIFGSGKYWTAEGALNSQAKDVSRIGEDLVFFHSKTRPAQHVTSVFCHEVFSHEDPINPPLCVALQPEEIQDDPRQEVCMKMLDDLAKHLEPWSQEKTYPPP